MRTIWHNLLWKEWHEHKWKMLSLVAITVSIPLASLYDGPETFFLSITSVLIASVFLSALFIGMGVAPPTPSWGSMCNEGIKTMLTTPHELIFPALLISLTVLAFNLLGDGLRDALDARMRNRE